MVSNPDASIGHVSEELGSIPVTGTKANEAETRAVAKVNVYVSHLYLHVLCMSYFLSGLCSPRFSFPVTLSSLLFSLSLRYITTGTLLACTPRPTFTLLALLNENMEYFTMGTTL